MKNMQDELEKKFRERFTDFEQEPEEEVLAGILQKVSPKSNPFFDKKSVSIVFGGMMLIGGISLLIFTGILVWYDWNQKNIAGKKVIKSAENEEFISKKNDTVFSQTTNLPERNRLSDSTQSTESLKTNPSLQNQSNSFNLKKDIHLSENKKFLSNQKSNFEKYNNNLNSAHVQSLRKSSLLNLLSSKWNVPQLLAAESKISKVPAKLKIPKLTQKPTPKTENHLFYGSISPLMSYYHVIPDKNDDVFVDKIDAGNRFSGKRLGWKMQFGLIFPVHPRMQVRTGILYSQNQQSWSYAARKSGDNFFTDYAFSKKSFQVGVKADVLYQLRSSLRFGTYALTGLEIQHEIGRSDFAPKFNYNWHIGGGVSYIVTSQIMLFAEPDFTVSFKRYADENQYLKVRPFHFGVNAGVVLKIEK